jgi:hypothetical protein
MTQRFFRATVDAYETVRMTLDAHWGHGSGKGTVTCFEPAVTAPRDSSGLVLLAVMPEFCEYPFASELLLQILASGMVEEIDESAYMGAVSIR